MEQCERIRRHEAALDRVAPVLKELESALDRFDAVQDDVLALSSYYGSEEWKEDYEADEAGRLPGDLKRGVLSEDGIYGFLHLEKPVIPGGKKGFWHFVCCNPARDKKKENGCHQDHRRAHFRR